MNNLWYFLKISSKASMTEVLSTSRTLRRHPWTPEAYPSLVLLMQLRSRQIPRDQLCRSEGTASTSTSTNLLPLSLRIWILLDSIFKLLSACIQIGSIEIRVSRFLYTSFWAETCVETNTRNEKLVFSSFVSPISRTFYEFRKHKTPKLVFYPTYKEWPE